MCCKEYPISGPLGLRYGILDPSGILPTERDDESIDLYCPRLTVVGPGQSVTVETYIKIMFPGATAGLVCDRSPDQPFKVDSCYFNEDVSDPHVRVRIRARDQTVEIQPGQAIAKMILASNETIDELLDRLSSCHLKYYVLDDGIEPMGRESSMDLYCPKLTVVAPGKRALVDTRVGFLFPDQVVGLVRGGSELFQTETLVYEGIEPLVVHVRNTSTDQTLEIQRGQVVAEIVAAPTKPVEGFQYICRGGLLNYGILRPDGIVPTEHAGVVDVYCPQLTVLAPRQEMAIDIGVRFYFPPETLGLMTSKDKQIFETRTVLMNNRGRGPDSVFVRNPNSKLPVQIRRGEVIANLMLISTKHDREQRKRLKKLLTPEYFSAINKYLLTY